MEYTNYKDEYFFFENSKFGIHTVSSQDFRSLSFSVGDFQYQALLLFLGLEKTVLKENLFIGGVF